jgi:hypothetical protein
MPCQLIASQPYQHKDPATGLYVGSGAGEIPIATVERGTSYDIRGWFTCSDTYGYDSCQGELEFQWSIDGGAWVANSVELPNPVKTLDPHNPPSEDNIVEKLLRFSRIGEVRTRTVLKYAGDPNNPNTQFYYNSPTTLVWTVIEPQPGKPVSVAARIDGGAEVRTGDDGGTVRIGDPAEARAGESEIRARRMVETAAEAPASSIIARPAGPPTIVSVAEAVTMRRMDPAQARAWKDTLIGRREDG